MGIIRPASGLPGRYDRPYGPQPVPLRHPRNNGLLSHCSSSATSSSNRSFSEMAGLCLPCREGPAGAPPGEATGSRDTWWLSFLGHPQSLVSPCPEEPGFPGWVWLFVCFRTIFLIVLFSQFLKNIAVPVPVFGGEKKCHTSKFYLFQVFPVRSTPHPPSSILNRCTWRVRAACPCPGGPQIKAPPCVMTSSWEAEKESGLWGVPPGSWWHCIPGPRSPSHCSGHRCGTVFSYIWLSSQQDNGRDSPVHLE